MNRILPALAAGLLFGLGLVVSGMINPAKVLAFLDVAGHWDPSLAFVMAGAIPVAAVGFWLVRERPVASCAAAAEAPDAATADKRLVSGSLLFGIGWGLVGYCPGPALAALGFADWRTFLFVIAMLVGMAIYEIWDRYGRLAPGRGAAGLAA